MVIPEGRLVVRWFRPADALQLADLHACCFRREAWRPADFQAFLDAPGRRNVVKVLTGEDSGTVYGGLLYTLEEDACRLRRAAVWPDFRRRGLGRFMVHAAVGPRSPMRRRTVSARVREGNHAAALFLRDGLGFAFDPTRPRATDADTGEEYYEFTLDRAAVPAR